MSSDQSTGNGCEKGKSTEACPTSNPRNWVLFKNVDNELLNKIKLFYVFGRQGASGLFTTSEDKVYGVGSNETGVLGIGSVKQSITVPVRLSQLDGKCVCKFASGDSHVLALTNDGKVFAWGNGAKGQLGSGELVSKSSPKQIDSVLLGKLVVDLACGPELSVAVTDDGMLFIFGLNCKDTAGLTQVTPTPNLMNPNGYPSFLKVVCGANSTHAICTRGNVYSFGLNTYKQLGFTNSVSYHQPKLTSMPPQDYSVTQLACGASHCLALTNEGTVYSWGRSNEGQLGRKNSVKYGTGDPSDVPGIGKVSEVAAMCSLELSVARSCDGQIYMWGMGETTPVLTKFRSIQEAFSHHTLPSVTYQTMVAHHAPTKNRIAESLRTWFNDEATCDIKFQLDGKLLYAHKMLLKMRCQYFRNMLDNNWRESAQDVIEIKGFSHEVYRAFLNYLYTDEIEPLLPAQDLLGLLELAHSCVESDLQSRCEMLIKRETTVENVATVYAVAVKFESTELEKFSICFAAANLPAVMKTESFKALADEVLRNFMAGAVEIVAN